MSLHDQFFKAMVPKRFARARIADFKDLTIPKKLEDGVLISGPVGTGKSHLAAAFVYGLMIPMKLDPTSFSWRTATNLLQDIKVSFDDAGIRTEDVLRRFESDKLIVIDDLGVGDSSDWAQALLLNTINERMDNLLPTVVTTNLRPTDLKAANPRLADRLRGFEQIVLTGKSRR